MHRADLQEGQANLADFIIGLAHARAGEEPDGERSGCRERGGPPIDVAGHLAIAANTDPSRLGGVWSWGAVPVGITVGPGGSVYWAQYRTNTIERADRDGVRRGTLAAVGGPLDVVADAAGGRIFYTSDRHYPRSIGSVEPGSKPRPLVCGVSVNRPFAIALADPTDTLYWTESINGRIRSADTGGEQLVTFYDDGISSADERPDALAMSPAGIAVDGGRGLIFWSDLRTATIVRARLDGSERKTILGRDQGLVLPAGLALDASAGKLYWADPGAETIGRADLDGRSVEVVASAADGVLEPYGLAIDGERRLLYWTDVARDALYRTGMDRKKIERFIDLRPDSASAPRAAAERDTCDVAIEGAQREFLRRWVKRVRTCVVGVGATKAVLRSRRDLAVSAGSCIRQLHAAGDASSLRSRLESRCDEGRIAAATDDALELGAAIVAADLPRSAQLLRDVRPFVARDGRGDVAVKMKTLAAIDDLVARLDRLDRAPTRTIDWTLPASGQTTRYGAVTQRAGAGVAVADDGATRAGDALTYLDNGDGTVSDPSTGLTWEKKCDGCAGLHDFGTQYPWRSAPGEMDAAGWLRAINSKDGTGLAGHDDWRLPETGELLSIVHYERFNPAIGDAFDGAACGAGCGSSAAPGCSCTGLGAYWTAGSSGDIVPVVLANLGIVVGRSAGEDAFVRAVRGPRVDRNDRFVDNGDGTITDRVTRLMWEKKCRCSDSLHDVDRRMHWSFDGTAETIWDWLSAVNEEAGSGFAGHDDWRVPNVKELYSLFDVRRGPPGIDPAFTGEGCADMGKPVCSVTGEGVHWTSTTFADFPSLAVAVGFGTPGALEREPPPGIIRVVGGVEPHEKALRRVTRAVRGPVGAKP